MKKSLFVPVLCIVISMVAIDCFANPARKIKMVNIPGKGYAMSATEVTQLLYEAVMEENPSNNKGNEFQLKFVGFRIVRSLN